MDALAGRARKERIDSAMATMAEEAFSVIEVVRVVEEKPRIGSGPSVVKSAAMESVRGDVREVVGCGWLLEGCRKGRGGGNGRSA